MEQYAPSLVNERTERAYLQSLSPARDTDIRVIDRVKGRHDLLYPLLWRTFSPPFSSGPIPWADPRLCCHALSGLKLLLGRVNSLILELPHKNRRPSIGARSAEGLCWFMENLFTGRKWEGYFTQLFISVWLARFSSLPPFQLTRGYWRRRVRTELSMPLPPEVIKRITVLFFRP